MPFGSHPIRHAQLRIPQVWRSFEYEKSHPHIVAAVTRMLEDVYQYGGLQRGARSRSSRKAAMNLIALAMRGLYGHAYPDAVALLRQAIKRRHQSEPEIRVPLAAFAPRP